MLSHPQRQTDPLKRSIEGELQHGGIRQRLNDFFRYGIPAGEVVDSNRAAVDGNTKQQDVKIRILGIFVNAALADVGAAPSLQIDTVTSDLMRLVSDGYLFQKVCFIDRLHFVDEWLHSPAKLLPVNVSSFAQFSHDGIDHLAIIVSSFAFIATCSFSALVDRRSGNARYML